MRIVNGAIWQRPFSPFLGPDLGKPVHFAVNEGHLGGTAEKAAFAQFFGLEDWQASTGYAGCKFILLALTSLFSFGL